MVEEELDDVVSAFRMVEEDKEGPVNEPGPLLQGLERRAHGLKTENTAANAQQRPATHSFWNFMRNKASWARSGMTTSSH